MLIPNTLPGSTIITQDNNLTIPPPVSSGPIVLVIGQALDGPVDVPVGINNLVNIESLFGPLLYTSAYPSPDGDAGKIGTFSGNTLVKTIREVLSGGGTNIIAVRTGGNKATSGPIFNGLLNVASLYPGNIYNGASIIYSADPVTGTSISCTQPNLKGQPFTMTFTPLTMFDTICSAFNNDLRNSSFRLVSAPTAAFSNAVTTPSSGTVILGATTPTAGTNGTLRDDFAGLTKDALFTRLTKTGGTFDLISGTVADIVTIGGIYADDCILPSNTVGASQQSFLTNFAQYCFNESMNSYPQIGVIGVSPLRSIDNPTIAARVASLSDPTLTGFADAAAYKLSLGQFLQNGIAGVAASGAIVDVGAYVSVFAGPDIIFSDAKLGQYSDSGSGIYAGILASLAVQRGATNVPLPAVLSTTYRLTRAQRNTLNAGVGYGSRNVPSGGGSYVTLSYSSLLASVPSLVITSDVSACRRDSVYSQTQHLRIVQAAEKLVDLIAYGFIGQPNNASTLMALDSQLQRALDSMVSTGALNGGKGSGYLYAISPGSSSNGTLGVINITLQLRPAYEIMSITTTVSV